DAHRSRTLITFEMIEHLLVDFGPPVDAVHELQRAGLLIERLAPAVFEPIFEAGGFLGEPDPQEAVKSERRVANPRVAIVPIPLAADHLGQTTGRGGNDRAGCGE